MRAEKSLKEIANMSSRERWTLAQKKLSDSDGGGAIDALLAHLKAHENTRWLVYSSRISNQVPRSFAAHAFTELQRAVLHYEIIRLCTFWDPVDLDSRSIPTIAALVDCSGVSRSVYDEHFKHYGNYDLAKARKWGTSARRRLREGVRGAKEIESSETLAKLRNYRDKLAHQLEQTSRERVIPVPIPHYGDERKLLNKTVTTLDRFYLSISGTSLDWSNSKKMHRRNAEAFWKGVNIEVLR